MAIELAIVCIRLLSIYNLHHTLFSNANTAILFKIKAKYDEHPWNFHTSKTHYLLNLPN